VHYKKATPMKSINIFWLVLIILLLSDGLSGQDTKSDVLAYSFSYITPYLISSDFLECEYAPVYLNVEANIHFKPFDRISFSSGLGYYTESETYRYPNWGEPEEEHDNYYTIRESNFRIPIQFNYHISKSIDKSDWYLKAVYTNGIFYNMVRSFENDILIQKRKSNNFYNPSVGLGIGSIFLKDKPVGIIVEGTIEKTLRWETFNEATYYSMKIGIVL
jgi:hypothetical protein